MRSQRQSTISLSTREQELQVDIRAAQFGLTREGSRYIDWSAHLQLEWTETRRETERELERLRRNGTFIDHAHISKIRDAFMNAPARDETDTD